MSNETAITFNAFPRRKHADSFPSCVKTLALLFILTLAAVVSAAPWERISPEEAGFDPVILQELDLYMQKNTGTTGLVVVVDGKVVHQYGDVQQLSYIASCRKSVLAMLYGNAVAEGKINLDATMKELGIDDVGGLLPSELEATVWDLITGRSGIYHPANSGQVSKKLMSQRGKIPHGKRFAYNNWDFNVAGTIFEQQTRKSIYHALEQQLAIPLGMEDFNLKKQKKSGKKQVSRHLAYHMYLSTRDMARLGELMRLNGRWDGKQLIPEEWCRRITSKHTKMNGDFFAGFGCMWWLLRDHSYEEEFKGAYTASGMHGQFITVVPALNMVVAHKSAGNEKKPTSTGKYKEILHRLLRAKECRRTKEQVTATPTATEKTETTQRVPEPSPKPEADDDRPAEIPSQAD